MYNPASFDMYAQSLFCPLSGSPSAQSDSKNDNDFVPPMNHLPFILLTFIQTSVSCTNADRNHRNY